MIVCRKNIVDKTLQEFYNDNKDFKDASMIGGPIVLLKLVVGNYYGIVDSQGEKLVAKCIDASRKPVFLTVNGRIGPLTVTQVIWEKTEEEMFKPDCCNG